MAYGVDEWSPSDLRRVLREQAGLDLAALTPADGGESRNAFWATDRAGTVSVLKVMPDATPEAADHLRTLDAVLGRLRDRGYPAPRFSVIGHVPGLVFWIQQRLPGFPADCGPGEPDRAALARLLPGLLRLNDAQAGLGTGPRQWPGLLTRTLTTGGDINPPVLAGDRAFDLATLLFYRYDDSDIRDLLRARLFDLAGPRAACAYLAHMVLRQVDWSLRHHPEAAATQRQLRLAAIITADIDRRSAH